MNEIIMVPLSMLNHHPDNPRSDLGDVTELADSIRSQGILQNLTVIPAKRPLTDREKAAFTEDGEEPPKSIPDGMKYWVVIGNRRLEAAKLAGVQEVPCRVTDMDDKEAMSTMIAENMQRQDLTVYDQAMGFQTMMDLGCTREEISQKTGVSDTTVRRRLKMAELDKDALREACEKKDTERQITLRDFEKLSQIESVKQRNALLKNIGSNSFEWDIKKALRDQTVNARMPAVKKLLRESHINKLPNDGDRYSMEYESMYSDEVDISQWKEGEKLIPQDTTDLFYFINDNRLCFYRKRKKAPPVKKTEEEKTEEKRRADAWARIEADEAAARQLRREYAEGIAVNAKNALKHLYYMMKCMGVSHYQDNNFGDRLQEALGLGAGYMDSRGPKVAEALGKTPLDQWGKIIGIFLDGEQYGKPPMYTDGYRNSMPMHKENPLLDVYYEWLTEFGYKMSDVEKQLQDGTHPSFAGGRQ